MGKQRVLLPGIMYADRLIRTIEQILSGSGVRLPGFVKAEIGEIFKGDNAAAMLQMSHHLLFLCSVAMDAPRLDEATFIGGALFYSHLKTKLPVFGTMQP
jgi:hypothetical protein